MSTRFNIATLVFMLTSTVLFGFGLLAVLLVPGLANHERVLIPAVVVISFIFAPLIAWVIAPRLKARYFRNRAA
jgi:hypothetical protein